MLKYLRSIIVEEQATEHDIEHQSKGALDEMEDAVWSILRTYAYPVEGKFV